MRHCCGLPADTHKLLSRHDASPLVPTDLRPIATAFSPENPNWHSIRENSAFEPLERFKTGDGPEPTTTPELSEVPQRIQLRWQLREPVRRLASSAMHARAMRSPSRFSGMPEVRPRWVATAVPAFDRQMRDSQPRSGLRQLRATPRSCGPRPGAPPDCERGAVSKSSNIKAGMRSAFGKSAGDRPDRRSGSREMG